MNSKEERQELFSGTLVLDGFRRSPEEQKSRIIQMMRLAGVEVGDESTLEIGYEGADDQDGISETAQTKFVVYRVLKKDQEDEKEILREEDLSDILQELKELRAKLAVTQSGQERAALIERISERTSELEASVAQSTKMDEAFQEELDALDKQIRDLQSELKNKALEYEASYNRLQAVIDEQKARLENSGLLSEEELAALREFYASKKLEENEKSIVIKQQIEEQKKLLTSLKRRKNKIERDMEMAEALGISVAELTEINAALNKRTILNAIFEKKGLADIVSKKASERTPEEKQTLKEAKEEIFKEISALKAANESVSALDAIQTLYSVSVQYRAGQKPKTLLVKERQLNNIRQHSKKIPEKIINDTMVQHYTPGSKPEDLKNVVEGMHSVAVEVEDRKEVVERVTFFKDMDNNGQLYARDYTMKRFHLVPIGDETKIEGATCYPIDLEDAEYIMKNSDNQYSPYQMSVEEVHLGIHDDITREVAEEMIQEARDVQEQILLYTDLDQNNRKYVRKYALTRFNLVPTGEEVRIDGASFYPIEEEDASYIIGNMNNQYSPYTVAFREIHLGNTVQKMEEKTVLPKVEESRGLEEVILLYRDKNNGNDAYVNKYALARFHIVPVGEEIKIDGKACYHIDNDDVSFIVHNAENQYSPYRVDIKDVELQKPKVVVPEEMEEEEITFYRNVENTNLIYANAHILLRYGINPTGKLIRINGINSYQISEKDYQKICEQAKAKENTKVNIRYEGIRILRKESKEVPKQNTTGRVEEILSKITNSLGEPVEEEVKAYRPMHLKASKKFIQELQSGEWVYNVIHYVPTVGKATYEFLENLSHDLMNSGFGNEGLKELDKRMKSLLSEEDMDTLFKEYSSSSLKKHFNNPVNRVIIGRLKDYGMDRIQKIDQSLQKDYLELYSLLGQVKSLETKIGSGKLLEEERFAYHNARKKLMESASYCIRGIMESRKAAEVLLSTEIPGIKQAFEEGNYAFIRGGMRDVNALDSELKQRYHEYHQEFEDALGNGDVEAIVSGFLGSESCFFKRPDVARSLVGRRSVGTKYCSSFAEEYHFHDDEFMRDMFTSVAVSSAIVRARYHADAKGEVAHSLQDIMNRYGRGAVQADQALEEVAIVARSAYDSLDKTIGDVVESLDPSKYDRRAIRSTMVALSNRAEALGDMNESLPEMTVVSSLPNDAREALLSEIGSYALAVLVASQMDQKYYKKSSLNDMLREVPKVEESSTKVY